MVTISFKGLLDCSFVQGNQQPTKIRDLGSQIPCNEDLSEG